MDTKRAIILIVALISLTFVTKFAAVSAIGAEPPKSRENDKAAGEATLTVDWDMLDLTKRRLSSVRALHGKQVSLTGFMMPLEAKKAQKQFLLTQSPPTCFFCMPGGPDRVVLVNASTPVKFVYDPITMTGVLKVAKHITEDYVYSLDVAVKTK